MRIFTTLLLLAVANVPAMGEPVPDFPHASQRTLK